MPLNLNDLNLIFIYDSAAITFCNELGLIDKTRYCKRINQKICNVEHQNSNFKCGICLECPNCHKQVAFFLIQYLREPNCLFQKLFNSFIFGHMNIHWKKHIKNPEFRRRPYLICLEMQEICEAFNKIYFYYKIGGES